MVRKITEWFVRMALAASFLSAVADRFGLWGAPGDPGVAWGAWEPFQSYTGRLNFYAPAALVPVLAWAATIAEAAFAIGLLIGWKLRWFALGSGLLLLSFAVTMSITGGVKGPLDYSVFTASAGALFLAAVAEERKK